METQLADSYIEESIQKTLNSISEASGRIIASPAAVIDQVSTVPISTSDFAEKLMCGEARFNGQLTRRLGGGAINFALASSSIGARNIYFAGFMSHEASKLYSELYASNPLILCSQLKARDPNTVVELQDGNYILSHLGNGSDDYSQIEIRQMINEIRSLDSLCSSDWIALCSFSLPFIDPLLELPTNFFLDSGYGNSRKIKKIFTAFCAKLRQTKSNSALEIIIAANELEMPNILSELTEPGLGLKSSTISSIDGLNSAFLASSFLSNMLSAKVSILYHTSELATLAEADSGVWSIPTFDLAHLSRRTNAGDTFAGTFLSAYRATKDPSSSVLLANLATAKRLADDQLPTPDNVCEFLKRSHLKKQASLGAQSHTKSPLAIHA